MKKTFLFVTTEDVWNKKSHYFFTDYLSQFFHIDYVVILKSFEKEFLNTELNSARYTGVIFWGEIFDPTLVKDVLNKNVTFVPLMDYVYTKKFAWWFRLRSIKIICFTKYLQRELSKNGFDTLELQYFPQIQNVNEFEEAMVHKPLNVYVSSPIDKNNKNAVEKFFKNISYEIQDKICDNTHVFLSLNKFVGIEKDMMEAISRGLILVGNNTPGFKDYVENNKNGHLYRFGLPLPINFSNMVQMQKDAIEKVKTGALKWNVHRKKLVGFLLKKQKRVTMAKLNSFED